jgi:hypothetical protein
MILHGSLTDNLDSALKSAQRHRGKAVYSDTVAYWNALLGHAREALNLAPQEDKAWRLVACLEVELTDRANGASSP